MNVHAWLPATPLVLPLLVGAFLAATNRHIRRALADTLAILAALGACLSSIALLMMSAREPIVYWFGGWTPITNVAIGISFAIDPLGAGAAAFAAFLVLLALVFSIHYFDSVGTIYHVLMMSFLGAMGAFALTGDLFNLFVWFELMSAAAFGLCGYKTEEAGPIQGALNFAVTNTVGAFIVLTGIALLYGRTGALNMAQVGRSLGQTHDSLVIVAFVFITCGFLVKAAIVPFHFWLADAHAVAPTPVCVLFSGIMVELGLYAVARVYWTVFAGALTFNLAHVRAVLVIAGTLTAIVGGLMCYAQSHIKRLLAFSTISHMGLLLIGFGLLVPKALAGAALYLVGHGAVKAALFICAGILLHRLGTVNEGKLRGKGKQLPGTAVALGLVALGLSGEPPFGTFLGEGMVDEAAKAVHYDWISYIFIFTGVVTAGAVLRVLGGLYFGWGHEGKNIGDEGESDEGRETKGDHNIPAVMYGPALLLLVLGVAITFVPGLRDGVSSAAQRFQDQAGYIAHVIDRSPLPQLPPEPHDPLLPAIIRGLVATALAIVLALVTVFRDKLPLIARDKFFDRQVAWAMHPIRAVHSGHMGDYVAWLTFGTAAFGGLFAWLVR
jgi:multicomponent Na+:H+ antiporter subunit D